MATGAKQRSFGVASTSKPASPLLSCRLPCLRGRRRHIRRRVVCLSQLSQETVLASSRPVQSAGSGAFSRLTQQKPSRRYADEDSALPLYACLDGDILTPANKFAYYEALRSGLKALYALGINGIIVDVYWGIVEGGGPGRYDWSAYKQLLEMIRDEGFMAQVCLCFHASESVPLPGWVAAAGAANPDIFYTDKAGARCTEYVSLGADEVPVLCGRTPLRCYRDLMTSFRRELGGLLGGTIVDVTVGLGPDGELKYPAHPRDRRWSFPGVGEFQCYDRYLAAGLRACAQQVRQPSWGLGGPHDAGAYCVWPSQTGFFHHQRGNWGSPYGRFFLQWYGDMLVQHADAVLGIAREVLVDAGGEAGGGLLLPSLGGSYGSSSSTAAYNGYYGAYGSGGNSPDSYLAAGSSTSSWGPAVPWVASSPPATSSSSSSWPFAAGQGAPPPLPGALTALSPPSAAGATPPWHTPPPPSPHLPLYASSASAAAAAGPLAAASASGAAWAAAAAAAAPPAARPPPVRLHAKLPGLYWWYGTASRAPELTAGYYNTATRDGYLPVMQVLARHGVSARLRSAELRTSELPPQACCDPERQIAAQRTAAAALGVGVGLANGAERFDDSALGRLESALFDTSTQQGIELPQVQSLVFSRMCDSMFEPGNWARFKDFVNRVRNRADTLVAPQQWRAAGGQQQQAAAAAVAAAARQQQQ